MKYEMKKSIFYDKLFPEFYMLSDIPFQKYQKIAYSLFFSKKFNKLEKKI